MDTINKASIGIKCKDNKIKVIYCHCDSNPNNTANILASLYNEESAVEQLLAKGNIFTVQANPEDIVYFVDRGLLESKVAPTVVECANEMLDTFKHKRFYLFDPETNQWSYHTKGVCRRYEWRPLKAKGLLK